MCRGERLGAAHLQELIGLGRGGDGDTGEPLSDLRIPWQLHGGWADPCFWVQFLTFNSMPVERGHILDLVLPG